MTTRTTILLLVAVMLAVGCPGPRRPGNDVAQQPPRPTPMVVAVTVVDDPQMAQVIRRQWTAEHPGQLDLVELTSDELAAAGFQLPAGTDVLVYPSQLLGALVGHQRLVPIVRDDWEAAGFARGDMLRHERTTLVQYGQQQWSVPLGSRTLMLVYRQDSLAAVGADAPRTWAEYGEVALRLRQLQQAGQIGSQPLDGARSVDGPAPHDDNRINPDSSDNDRPSELAIASPRDSHSIPTRVFEPLQGPWAAQVLLSRGISAIGGRGTLSTMFDISTMRPVIQSPAYVHALTQMQAAAEGFDWLANPLSPVDAYREVVAGRAAMALCWPVALDDLDPGGVIESIGVSLLPIAERWYDVDRQNWHPVADDSADIQLIGPSGRVASIGTTSRNRPAALQMLQWLASRETSMVVSAQSPYAGPFRRSHLQQPQPWTGERLPPAAIDQWVASVERLHDQSTVIAAPRLPGTPQYLAALSENVRRVIAGELQPEEALQATAEEWERITQSLGDEEQRTLYRQSLGLPR